MTSEEQHYSAKIFLRDYFQAITVLKECAERAAYKQNYFEMINHLGLAFKNKEIGVKDGKLVAGQNIRKNRLTRIQSFHNDFYSKYFPNLESSTTAASVKKILQKGLESLNKTKKVEEKK